ncbi:hypothetical protein ES703_14137 [subsurface metagenome]
MPLPFILSNRKKPSILKSSPGILRLFSLFVISKTEVALAKIVKKFSLKTFPLLASVTFAWILYPERENTSKLKGILKLI